MDNSNADIEKMWRLLVDVQIYFRHGIAQQLNSGIAGFGDDDAYPIHEAHRAFLYLKINLSKEQVIAIENLFVVIKKLFNEFLFALKDILKAKKITNSDALLQANEVLSKISQKYENELKDIQKYFVVDSLARVNGSGDIMSKFIEEMRENKSGGIKIFISHSHQDSVFAEKFIELLQDFMPSLLDEEIRCTSVSQYALPAGAQISDILKSDLNQCNIIIGIISEASKFSSYVLFELGVGWSQNKAIPILCGNVSYDDMPGPLKQCNALSMENIDSSKIIKLMNDLSIRINAESKQSAGVVKKIDNFINWYRDFHDKKSDFTPGGLQNIAQQNDTCYDIDLSVHENDLSVFNKSLNIISSKFISNFVNFIINNYAFRNKSMVKLDEFVEFLNDIDNHYINPDLLHSVEDLILKYDSLGKFIGDNFFSDRTQTDLLKLKPAWNIDSGEWSGNMENCEKYNLLAEDLKKLVLDFYDSYINYRKLIKKILKQ
ncbi:MAG: toll/interleukin-1 receptor domain-containing protein [Magnetococcales bacterium]|nr:toll/interleukin-1 receptor domain-containing protein [Magnetococcales bacterium]